MEDPAPFSEHSPASLTVQSRISPTEGKMASHCLREACLTGESLERRHAVRRSKGRLSWNRWKCGVAADLDVKVVLLECLTEGPAELETILLEAKKGAIRVRSQM